MIFKKNKIDKTGNSKQERLKSLVIEENLKVLYVEDDEMLRAVTSSLLINAYKFNVKLAKDGVEGIEKYKELQPDIVITDIDMPNMNGVKMSKEIKKINDKQNIVVISAHDKTEYFLDFIEIGVNAFVIKPINKQKIENILLEICQKIVDRKYITHYEEQKEKWLDELTNKDRELKRIENSLKVLKNNFSHKNIFDLLEDLKDIFIKNMPEKKHEIKSYFINYNFENKKGKDIIKDFFEFFINFIETYKVEDKAKIEIQEETEVIKIENFENVEEMIIKNKIDDIAEICGELSTGRKIIEEDLNIFADSLSNIANIIEVYNYETYVELINLFKEFSLLLNEKNNFIKLKGKEGDFIIMIDGIAQFLDKWLNEIQNIPINERNPHFYDENIKSSILMIKTQIFEIEMEHYEDVEFF